MKALSIANVAIAVLALIVVALAYVAFNTAPSSPIVPCQLPQAAHDLQLQPCN